MRASLWPARRSRDAPHRWRRLDATGSGQILRARPGSAATRRARARRRNAIEKHNRLGAPWLACLVASRSQQRRRRRHLAGAHIGRRVAWARRARVRLAPMGLCFDGSRALARGGSSLPAGAPTKTNRRRLIEGHELPAAGPGSACLSQINQRGRPSRPQRTCRSSDSKCEQRKWPVKLGQVSGAARPAS